MPILSKSWMNLLSAVTVHKNVHWSFSMKTWPPQYVYLHLEDHDLISTVSEAFEHDIYS